MAFESITLGLDTINDTIVLEEADIGSSALDMIRRLIG